MKHIGLCFVLLHIAWLWSCCWCCHSMISLSPGEHTEITSPNFGQGQEYPKSTECTWHVASSVSEKLTVAFHTFDLEFHVSCAWDYVEITDGTCVAGSGQKHCGSSLPLPYFTSVKSLCIRFHSDIIISKAGFNLTVSASALKPSSSSSSTITTTMTSPLPQMTSELPHIACQGGISVITHSATISSPGFGVNPTYPNNAVCVWVVELQESQIATVTFESFALESHPFCGYDWLKVFDGPHLTSSVKKTFCGYSVPTSFTLAKSTCLKFRSDIIVPKAGFMARIEIKTSSSFVTSAPTVFSTLSTSTTLASSTNSLGTTTSSSTSSSSSSSSSLPSMLSSSSSSSSQSPVSYVEMCKDVDEVFDVSTTMLLSPDYHQGFYPISTSCYITIQTSLGQRLDISFLEFDLELHPTCGWDSLTLYDGSCYTGTHMGKYCGSSLIQNFTTTHNKLCVIFFSDFIVPKQGFKAVIQSFQDSSTNGVTFSSKDTTTFDVTPEIPVTSHISLNSLDTESASVPPGTSFSVPASPSVATGNQPTTVYQSSATPSSSTSSTSTTISSSSSVLSSSTSTLPSSLLSSSASSKPPTSTTQTSPLLTYLFQNVTSPSAHSLSSMSSTTQNQAVLTSSLASSTTASAEGVATTTTASLNQTVSMCSLGSVSLYSQIVITSPNFGPGLMYPLKTTCTLCVSSAKSKKLHMRFTEFDVELHPSCAWDSVTVYDGSSTASPVLATLCGDLPQAGNVTSSSNSLCLKFVSDFMAPRHGFRAVLEPVTFQVVPKILQHVSKSTVSTTTTTSEVNTTSSTLTTTTSVDTTITTTTALPTTTGVTTTSTPGTTSSSIFTNVTDTTPGTETKHPATQAPVTTSTATTSAAPLFTTLASTSTSSSSTTSHTTTNSTTISSTSGSSGTSSAAFTTLPIAGTTNSDLETACSGAPLVLESESGTITSPGFPALYPNNLDCKWIINAPKHRVVQIFFTSFELEFHGKCDWDSLTIYKGGNVTDDVIVKLCGDDIPDNMTTSGGKVLLHLHTDRIKAMTGFSLTYHTALSSVTTVSPPLTCPGGSVPCDNGTCIPTDWLCDGEYDCLKGEDEQNCGQCTDKKFHCGNGSCIPSYRRCDGHGDCEDKEDEDNCVTLDSDDRNGTLLIMRSGTWFPVCFDQWEAEFSDAACEAADFGLSIQLEGVTSSSTSFLIPAEVLSGNQKQFHTNFKLRSSCSNGEVVSLSCQSRECGLKSKNLPSAYILGGSRSVRGEWPWVVSLVSGTKMVCGATVISERWAVTAGHCVETLINSPQTTYIVAGTVNLKSPDVEYLRVTEMILHPDHNFIYNADIALVHLQRPLQFSNRVKPLCLPTRQHRWQISLPCYIAGWGVSVKQNILPGVTSPYLHHAKLKLWQQKKCRDVYETKVKDTMICAGHQYGEVDACKGDSGSPLMCRTGPDKWEFVGVTSWGEGCGLIGKPGVYTRVDHYINWIHEQTTHTDEVDCDFESPGICGYQDNSNTDYIWTRRKGGIYEPQRPFTDSTFGTTEGHYMYAFISYEAKNQVATLSSPEFFNSGYSCLTFYVTFMNAKDAKLRVYGTYNSSDDLTLLMQLTPLQGDWRLVEHELSGDVRRVLFVAEAGRWTTGGVGIDDVIIEDMRCEGFLKVNCDFDSGTLCEYLQAEDDTFDWNLKPVQLLEDDSKAPPGHSTDHYIEADGSSRNPGDKTRVLSPTLNTTVPQCISFRYRIQPPQGGTLSVCTESTYEGQVFLNCNIWSRANSVDNDWTDGQAQIPASAYPYRIGFQAESFAGVIAIDNLSKKDGVCQL